MKFLKIGLISSTILLFIIACNQTRVSETDSANNAAVVNVASNNNQTATATDELASARKTYSQICVNCHKQDGKGGVTNIEGKRIKAPDFTAERMKNDEDADWIETIENGEAEEGMPAFKNRLSNDEIKNLVRFIRKEFQGKM